MSQLTNPEAAESTGPRAGRREWIALAVLMLPLLLVSMDVSVLYFAVPFIAQDLEPTATQQLWIFDVYGFVLAGLLLTMGAVGDRIGRRRLLLIGAAGFGLASCAAAYASTPEMLIAARAVLGIAGATLMPSTLALLRNLFLDEKQRATAIGIWTAVMSGGVAVGPVLSGLLLEHFWWGSVFLVNLPAMALLLVLVPFLVPEFAVDKTRRFDLPGAVLSLLAVLPVVYGVKQVAAQDASALDVAAIAFGLAAGAAFVVRLRTARHPMLDTRLFVDRGFRSALLCTVVAMFALVGNAVFTTQYLQSVLGMSPLVAALWSLAPTVVVGAAAPTSVSVARKVGSAVVEGVGFLLAALGLLSLTLVDTDGLVVVLLGATALAAGLVSVLSVAGETAMRTISPERAGAASALMETASELGGALGMALLGSVGAWAYRNGLDLPAGVPGPAADAAHETLGGALAVAGSLPDSLAGSVVDAARLAFVDALHAEVLVGAALMLIAAAVTLAGTRRS